MLKLKFPMTASYTDSRILYLRSFGKGLLWKTARCFSPKVLYSFPLEEKFMQHRAAENQAEN